MERAKYLKKRKRHQEVLIRPSAKRRRLTLKQERSETRGAQKALDSVSYQSDRGLQSDVGVASVPDAVPRGDFKPIKLHDPPTIIAMDLETTGLIRDGQMPHITQIAAKVVGRKRTFTRYVKPKLPISPSAQQITGISMVNDRMFVRGEEVTAIDIHMAIDQFLEWIKKFDNVVVAAHNGVDFDFPVLVSALTKLNKFDGLLSCVAAFLDSLPLFHELYPDRSTYKQETLAFEILNISYNAHDAENDVFALSKLIKHARNTMTKQDFHQHLFSPKAIHFQ